MLQKLVLVYSVPLALILLICIASMDAQSPPGQPEVTKCRSYEQETFTCWWEPGSDGGLPTNYSLIYWTEKNNTHTECPDYQTSGPHSCYFDKAHSSIWVYYFVYVKATNALGSNISDTLQFEVVHILEPYPPRNLTLAYESNKTTLPYLLVKWIPPQKADVKIGWVTLKYEVRLKDEKKQEWESHVVGQQTYLKVFSPAPGENYVVQVRCKADTGLWSQWSEESYIPIPGDVKKRDLTLWISIAVLSVIICLTMIWTMALKGCSWVSCICPPVPGPKIMGFDTQLLKSGKSEDFLSALGCQGFPPTSDCEDLLVEFLEVDDSKEQLIPTPEREPQGQPAKVPPVDTDNDSGRGSCDSPFAPSEGSKDQRVLSQGFENVGNGGHEHPATKCPWPVQNEGMATTFSNFGDQSYIWSDGRASGNQCPKSSYHNLTDVCKMALGAMSANMSAFLMPNEEKSQPRYFRTVENIEEGNLNKQSDLGDLHSKGVDIDTLHLLLNKKTSFMPPRTMDYVEVHKVNQNNALALLPKHKENVITTDQYSVLVPNREYSKVERVDGDNVLVLMQNLEAQVSPVSSDAMKEFFQKSQQNQAEKLVGFNKPVRTVGEIQTAGMGYMDPSSFFP
ncbi:prolactin receptor [Pseudophryne corroboree]|uniref:prolactin receptor n=1 Tax=Pseudophryne corroboree TaxID=495146 RepID=UPI0030821710